MNANQTGPPDDQGFNPFREDLRGRCGIITGAASGIGRATAFYLARCGANLVLSDVNAAALQSAAGEIEALGVKAPLALEVDVTREKQVARLVEETVTGLGRIDFLVTSAGILRRTPFLSMTSEEWDLVLGINLRGVFLCCRAVAAVMAGQKQGVIVNLASLAGRSSSILGGAHYTASKHAVIGLSRHMARELGPQGLRVNAFCPGATYTPMVTATTDEAERQRLMAANPLGRWALPEEQASVIAFLLSDAASFINGAALDSNGGALMI